MGNRTATDGLILRKLQTCNHVWVVWAGIFCKLSVQCPHCGLRGLIEPTVEEWTAAFDAMRNPYVWPGSEDRIRNRTYDGRIYVSVVPGAN